MNRKQFIQQILLSSALAKHAISCKAPSKIPGTILGASADIGHLLRDGVVRKAEFFSKKKIVIVGGGISGLSAARTFAKNGIEDFVLLDLEKQVGGNAAYGRNAASAFPLGAHYLPTPNNNLKDYLEFLYECNVITEFNAEGLPVYNELHLCFDSQERLFLNGKWQDGLVPHHAVPADELKEIELFLSQMDIYRKLKGSDGKDAFAIPVDDSSTDDEFVKLDAISMRTWMLDQGFTSGHLHWYVNYCTRDDFGTTHTDVSAWAGIHYFAARKGKGVNALANDVITWPEGNGFLVEALQKNVKEKIINNALGLSVTSTATGVRVEYFDVKENTVLGFDAEHCVLAVPQFVASRLLNSPGRTQVVKDHYRYVPWMVANILVSDLQELNGVERSWDNVIYNSESLGYVDASHQLLSQKPALRNLSYYLPLTKGDVLAARREAQTKSHEEWVELIIADLEKVHPAMRKTIKEINVMLWGHAMVQPLPGMIFGSARKQLQHSIDEKIHFAHTDIAGISIFEEGFYQGLRTAKKIIESFQNR